MRHGAAPAKKSIDPKSDAAPEAPGGARTRSLQIPAALPSIEIAHILGFVVHGLLRRIGTEQKPYLFVLSGESYQLSDEGKSRVPRSD
jgi:hypothetical protein